MNKNTIISLFIAAVLIIGSILLVGQKNSSTTNNNPTNSNVSIENDIQIIEITTRGGYSPQYTLAKANIPTIIRMKTSGTFSCASSLVIPKIDYRSNLPPTGTVDIPIEPQKVGSEITGLCAMGMYNFSIKFN
ncbi:MAG: hypothetical protein WCW14_00185 [Candidatus Paceibacterota bacterium]|jgi:plastocyanin domain-containing protein